MKKITSLALALALALTLTACGKKDNTAGSGDSSVPADATALLTAVWDAHSDDEKFPAAGGDYENPVEDAPGAVSIADADNLNYMLTLPVEDAGKIDGAASLSHMMNANTFTCGAFHVTSKDDVETVASDLRDAIQSKQWMCGFPDKLVIFTYDQYVVSLYGDEELVNTFRDKFTATYSDRRSCNVSAFLTASAPNRADAVKFNFGVALCCFPVFRFSIPFYPAS